MNLLFVIFFIMIGSIAGFLAGLLGIGGGLITVPALIMLFSHYGYFPDTFMQTAIGTSLAAMVFTSASSAWAHHLKKGIIWNIFRSLAPGVAIGSLIGALIVEFISSASLRLIIGIFECLIGIYFFLPSKELSSHKTFKSWIYLGIGAITGLISTILGVGGGIITVPILTALQVPLRNAISTSAILGLVIALIGMIALVLLGISHENLKGTLGYVYVPAFLIIGITSSLVAPLGAKYAYLVPVETLKKIFGTFLLLVGIWMLYPK